MEKDHRDILLALNAQHAKYLIVGGFAMGTHAEPRATKDLDLWIKTDEANSLAVYHALVAYGAPMKGVTPEDFNETAKTGFQIGLPPLRIDILHSIDGVNFDEAWDRRVETQTEDGIAVYVISREDLLTNKLTVGRLQDIADVDAIRKASRFEKPKN
jgi:hypothetical protein